MIAALYVETNGNYYDVPGIDPWNQVRDARLYNGPFPVVCHPPCSTWGPYRHKTNGYDEGCFEAALSAVRRFKGVLEHPAKTAAFHRFNLPIPTHLEGWSEPDVFG